MKTFPILLTIFFAIITIIKDSFAKDQNDFTILSTESECGSGKGRGKNCLEACPFVPTDCKPLLFNTTILTCACSCLFCFGQNPGIFDSNGNLLTKPQIDNCPHIIAPCSK